MTTRNVTGLFSQSAWDSGSGPFSDATLIELGLEDITSTNQHYLDACGTGDILGFYRDGSGQIWRADFEAGDEVYLTKI